MRLHVIWKTRSLQNDIPFTEWLNRKFTKTSFIMEAIVERTPRTVTVRMSTRRWNRMLQLEETYKLARIIKRSMKQVESEPSMTQEEAIAALRAL